VEAVKFLWKRKHFEKKSWKRMQTRKRLTLYGAGSGSKKYSTVSTSLNAFGFLHIEDNKSLFFWRHWFAFPL